MKSICIIGTGGMAKEVLSLLNDLGRYDEVEAFMEPDHLWDEKGKDKEIMGKKVIPMSMADPEMHQITVAMSSIEIRQKSITQLPSGIEFISLIHPNAQISKWANIGEGAIIFAGCIVSCDIEIGIFSHLHFNTVITHDNIIGDFFTTAPSVNINGNCQIGSRVYMGCGAATRQGVSICNDVIIGMGAMVVQDITEPGTYIGIPAKKLIK